MIHFIIQSSINCRQDIDIIAITWYHQLHVHMLHLILYVIYAKKINVSEQRENTSLSYLN